MSNAENQPDARRLHTRAAAKYYFLTVWAICLFTFVLGEFNPTVKAFIFKNFWWFVVAIGSAIAAGPLLFPRGVAGLARDLKEYQRRIGRREER